MESAAIIGARWVLGKALSPLSGGLVEAWAATTELEPNIEALKTELLYAEAMVENARSREIRSHALGELLQKLHRLAYSAEDVLDELDYFRIQDELEDTFEALEESSLVRDVRHAARAAAKQLFCASCTSTARGSNVKTCKCVRQLASRARTTAHTFGKRLHFSSPLSAPDDSKHAPRVPKLKFDRVNVSRRMKCITDELKPLCAKVSTILGLELSGSVIAELRLLGSSRGIGNVASSSRSITTSQTLEPRLYGRDPQKNTIIEDITNGEYSHRDLTVIPIVGAGGIGKTTLTQYIYNNNEVHDHFQIHVWVCVSLDFSVYKLTQEILSSIPNSEDQKNDRPDNEVQNLDQLQKLIEKRIKNRRFLLVLDDIWNCGSEDEWKRFLLPFVKKQGNGDTILVTTRFLEVAKMIKRGDKLLKLEGLEPEEYWRLFLACIFDETYQQHNDKNLLEIGKKIVEKLKGSPLAAKTVGRLLRQNLTTDHWTRVLESREWESQTSDHDIMPALKLSYVYLPFHLQKCFSSCALFPEDYEFGDEELIHFWIGLDILHPSQRTKRIEDIGHQNLNDLVNYGFFKREAGKSCTYYVMHDMLHDLALNVSSQECLHIASSSRRAVEIAPFVYHLSISISDLAHSEDGVFGGKLKKELGKISNIVKLENLRTLMLFGIYDLSFVPIFSDLLKAAKSLRVVFLSTMCYPVKSLLHNLSKLVHLRYLRVVSLNSNMEHLPWSISRFYQLRVLDIRSWHGAPSFFGNMTNLVKLRHFLPRYDELHSNIPNVGKLHSLQELHRFEVKKERSGFDLSELGKLEELGGSLRICNLGNALVNEAHEAKLLYKNRVRELTLNWKKGGSNTNSAVEDELLEGLQPHNNLHELCIDGHGGSSCPTWLSTNLSIRGLESLRLSMIDWESFPSLGELYMVRQSGEEYLSCTTGPHFRNLKKLELIGLQRFRKWVANEFCPWYFSLIEVLTVKQCHQLTELPFSSYTCYPSERDLNMTWFPRLREIEIVDCPKLLSLPPIPYSHTLCSVKLRSVVGLQDLFYKNTSPISLSIHGNAALHSLDETVLAFHNLTQLEKLSINNCPPLAEEHLQMLTSMKTLHMYHSSIMFLPLETSDVKWRLPVTDLQITCCSASGKELTRLLSHIPMLSCFTITNCFKITLLGVEAEQQQTAAPLSPPASSAVKLQDTHGTDQQQEIAHEVEEELVEAVVVEEEEEDDDDGLLLLPANLSDCMQNLDISDCSELILTAKNRERGGGGLQAMRSLKKIEIEKCPKFLSAYKDSDLSYYPFPSSLQHLELSSPMEGMDTLVPLSNLTSLQNLSVWSMGEDFKCEGLLPLLTQGQLTILKVSDSPKFFAGWDPAQALQGEQEQPFSKLQELETGEIAGFLALPICRLFSSSLTKLSLDYKDEKRFTKEQEEALFLLTSLQDLQFRSCKILRSLPSGLHKLTSLKRLQIYHCSSIRSLPENGLPRSLEELAVDNCYKLPCLPAGLHKLTNLKRLQIFQCHAIRSLPKNGLPSSLQELDVRACGNKELEQQCWRLVGTIPLIKM